MSVQTILAAGFLLLGGIPALHCDSLFSRATGWISSDFVMLLGAIPLVIHLASLSLVLGIAIPH